MSRKKETGAALADGTPWNDDALPILPLSNPYWESTDRRRMRHRQADGSELRGWKLSASEALEFGALTGVVPIDREVLVLSRWVRSDGRWQVSDSPPPLFLVGHEPIAAFAWALDELWGAGRSVQ